MNKLEKLLFWLKTGAKVQDLSDADETVIRFKGHYINVLENEDGICSLAWSDNPNMTHVPVRQFWTATPPLREEKETK